VVLSYVSKKVFPSTAKMVKSMLNKIQ